jgi:hypothetical protein
MELYQLSDLSSDESAKIQDTDIATTNSDKWPQPYHVFASDTESSSTDKD